jgi:hypothetical protein
MEDLELYIVFLGLLLDMLVVEVVHIILLQTEAKLVLELMGVVMEVIKEQLMGLMELLTPEEVEVEEDLQEPQIIMDEVAQAL